MFCRIIFFSLYVEEINQALDNIAQANVEKKRDEVKSIIQRLIRNTSALEQKWLIRIMLKVIGNMEKGIGTGGGGEFIVYSC